MSDTSKNEKKSRYLTGKESREIARENKRLIKELEKEKKRKNVDESEYTTKLKDPNNIVEFDNLHTYFFTDAGITKAVNGVSFSVPEGSVVGIVGESGCGKSVTSLSLMQLIQGPQGQIVSGEIRFKSLEYKKDHNGKPIPIYKTYIDDNGEEKILTEPLKNKKGEIVKDKNGETVTVPVQDRDDAGVLKYEMEEKVFDIAKMPISEMSRIRGRQIAMIFQEPMTSLNPVFTIGDQLNEVTLLHVKGASKEEAKRRSLEMLELVGIAMPDRVYKSYPHEISGGMRQRVMIAMALACNPRLVIADEPTTALDVTIQAQILDLLRDVRKKMKGSIMLITHDLGVIAEMADYVYVMYAGKVVEQGTVREIFKNPLHPYTIGLQKSKPVVGKEVDELYCIPGQVPNPVNMPDYCYFRERCNMCTAKCGGKYPAFVKVSPTHGVACYRYTDKSEMEE
ncbi:MAG TPA: dipeptide/oligopeptide/nickel ABC transporter ATP-binding protein [Clostridiales bacterium]|nr:dipeptide/oligopeptide/nickel ABC transporter ATP-binding protein [Clostridiales bacterium]